MPRPNVEFYNSVGIDDASLVIHFLSQKLRNRSESTIIKLRMRVKKKLSESRMKSAELIESAFIYSILSILVLLQKC
jgi:hypothetical protein